MRKLGAVIVAVVLLAAGCGSTEDGLASTRETTTQETTTQETTTQETTAQETTAQDAPAALDVEFSSPAGPGAPERSGTGDPADGDTIVATAITPVVVARSEPSASALELASFDHPRPLGGPLVFQVVGLIDGPWLEVKLPMRPNGSTGWIEKTSVALSSNPYRIEIDVSDHRLVFSRDGQLILDTTVAIGTGATPTPRGSFYLTDLVQPVDPGGPYGSYAYGLSGFSETLESFNGGDGVIGIHGTNDPSSLGGDVSHGCVRLHNDEIEQLVALLPLGTPVEIVD